MKKIISLMISIFLTIVSIAGVNALGSDTEIISCIEMIRSFVYTFDKKNVGVEYVKDLKDIYNNYTFSLYKIDEDGYAVISHKNYNLVEIMYSNFPTDDVEYYLGAGSFSSNNINTLVRNQNEELIKKIEAIKKLTDNILNEDKTIFKYEIQERETKGRPYPNKPSVIAGGTTVGISDSQMDIFNGSVWTNSGNRCGAYAAGVMITYMDKYHGGKYFKESGSYSSGQILNRLFKTITGSSTAYEVVLAINKIFIADYPTLGKSGFTTSSESTYKSKIKSKYPVCLLLQSSKGSGYGDHFVCAYQYVDYNGKLWFKVHDNWSGNNHRGWVNRNWILQGVYTN